MPDWRNRSVNSKKEKKRLPKYEERDTVSPCPLNIIEPEAPTHNPTSSSSSAIQSTSNIAPFIIGTTPEPSFRRSTPVSERICSPSPSASGLNAFENWPEEHDEKGSIATEEGDNLGRHNTEERDEQDIGERNYGESGLGHRTEYTLEPSTPICSTPRHRKYIGYLQVSPDTDDGQPEDPRHIEQLSPSSPSRLPTFSSPVTATPDPRNWELSSPAPPLPISSPLTPPPVSQTTSLHSEKASLRTPPPARTREPATEPSRSASTTPTNQPSRAYTEEAPASLPEATSVLSTQHPGENKGAEAGTPDIEGEAEGEEEEGIIGLKEIEEEARRSSAESSPLSSIPDLWDGSHSPYHFLAPPTGISATWQLSPTISSSEFRQISPSAVDATSHPNTPGSARLALTPNGYRSAPLIAPIAADRPISLPPESPRSTRDPTSGIATPLILTPVADTVLSLPPAVEPVIGLTTESDTASAPFIAEVEGQQAIPESVGKRKGRKRANLGSNPSRRKSARISAVATADADTAVSQSNPSTDSQTQETPTIPIPDFPIPQNESSPSQVDPADIVAHQDQPSSPLSSPTPSKALRRPTKAEKYQDNLDLFNLHHTPTAKNCRSTSVPPSPLHERKERNSSCAPSFVHLGADRYYPVSTRLDLPSGITARVQEDIETEIVIQEDTDVQTKEVPLTAYSPIILTEASQPTIIGLTQDSIPDPHHQPFYPPFLATALFSANPESDSATAIVSSGLKRPRSPSPPSAVIDQTIIFKHPPSQLIENSMSAKRQRTDSHPAPNPPPPAQRAPSPSSTQSSLSPPPDSPVKQTATPSIGSIKIKLPAGNESMGKPRGELDESKGGARSGIGEDTGNAATSTKGGTRGTKRKSISTNDDLSTIPADQPPRKITLKLGGKKSTASVESTTPAGSPPPSAMASSFGTPDIAGPSGSNGKSKRPGGTKSSMREEDVDTPPAKRRGTRTSSRANSPNRPVGGPNPTLNLPDPEDVIMKEHDNLPDPSTPATASVIPAGKGRPGRGRTKRIVDSPEAESAAPALTPPTTSTGEPIPQPTPVPIPHQDPTPPVSTAPTPPGGNSPKPDAANLELTPSETKGKEGASSDPQIESQEAQKGPEEKIKGEGKKTALGKFKKKAGVPSVSTPGGITETPKKASAPSTPTTTPTPGTATGSAKSAKPGKPLPSTTTPKVTPLPKKTAASAVGSASKLGPRSSTGTPSTSTPVGSSASKPVAAPSSLLAATLSQLKQTPSSASKQDTDVKKKEMPKIQKVERFPVYVRTAKEEEDYAASADERARERARREEYKKDALYLNFARDTYKLDSLDKHKREIDVSGHMGIITSGMPLRILKHIFGLDAIPHGIKQAQEEAADADRARRDGREPDIWGDDDDDPEWPVRSDGDWFFDWKGVKDRDGVGAKNGIEVVSGHGNVKRE